MKVGNMMRLGGMVLLVVAARGAAEGVDGKEATGGEPEARTVRYERVGVFEYQNFLRNWDDEAHPRLYALVQSPAHYNALFAPAAVMGNRRPFAPLPELFTQESIVLVARVMPAPGDMEKVFTADRVTVQDRALEVHYRYAEPEDAAAHKVINFLALRVPKQAYRRVTFFENGKRVGALDVAGGQWMVPEPAPDPDA